MVVCLYSMAFVGQEVMHAIQCVQFPFHFGLPPVIVMFESGQAVTHIPHPIHADVTQNP